MKKKVKQNLLLLFLSLLLIVNYESYSRKLEQSPEQDSILNHILEIGKQRKPAQRGIFFYEQRAFPFKHIPSTARIKAIEDAQKLLLNKFDNEYLLAQEPEWRCIGPYNIGGRVRTVVHHPTHDSVVYIGAAAGGIWKTTDGGKSWTPIFDNENSISMGALAIDHNNPEILYAGTGEAANNIDSYLGSGMYKSTDGGNTWILKGLTNVGSFSKVYVHPKNSNLIYAGAMKNGQGLWKSTDAGETWMRMLEASISDLSINPENTDELVSAVYGQGIAFTSDGGNNWIMKNNGLPIGLGRISVQYAPSNPNILYALMEVSTSSGIIAEIYKTTNKGTLWIRSYQGNVSFFNNQGFYNNFIQVHPTDPNIVLAGGIHLWKTSNGGISWNMVMDLQNGQGQIHVDQHCAAFNPKNPNQVYIGNDGGMYYSTNAGNTWFNINNNLPITQFYAMAIDLSKVNRNYGGTQDNGTLSNFTNPDQWRWIMGGDGFDVLIDWNNPNIIYGEYPNGRMWRINFSNNSYDLIGNGIPDTDQGLWHSPMAMSTYDSKILYHGRSSIYISYNGGDYWYSIKNTSQGNAKFSAIKVSPINADILFAGTNQGHILVSNNMGENWTLVSSNKGLPLRYVTDFALSWEDENVAYVTFSGYNNSHVFKTTNLGQSWTDISQKLPDVPVNSIVIHPENSKILFLGTDIGVFVTFDDGLNWYPYGKGLTRSPVVDLKIHTNKVLIPNFLLRAATHGRSMWEIDIPTNHAPSPQITIPAGGEKYISTTVQKIVWYGFNLPVTVEYSFDDGITWNIIAKNVNSNSIEWQIPNKPTTNARIRVSSESNNNQIKVTNQFTILLKNKGSVLFSTQMPYTPYGLAYDGKGGLWTTTFGSNQIIKLNSQTFAIEKTLNVPGDTLTDLAFDKEKGIIYVHRMFNTQGGGGLIYIIDTNGTLIKQRPSPATEYPIGLEIVDGKLIVGDRDGQRFFYETDPDNGNILNIYRNACQDRYGPRGLEYDGKEFLFQVCTFFPSSSSSLENAYIQKIHKNDLGTELERIRLESLFGLINARGIAYDPSDKNFWISDFGGMIYKIAGFETIVSVFEKETTTEKIYLHIYPNPIKDFGNIYLLAYENLNVNIYLQDLLGNKIARLFSNHISKNQEINIPIYRKDIPQGIYFIVIYNGKYPVITRKILISN